MEEFDHEIIEYLKEFESTVMFDGEICPTCGLDFSQKDVKIAKWVKIKDNLLYSELENIASILDEEKIHYYFMQNTESEKSRLYYLLILNDSVERVEQLLNQQT